jgi:hypothetical protein
VAREQETLPRSEAPDLWPESPAFPSRPGSATASHPAHLCDRPVHVWNRHRRLESAHDSIEGSDIASCRDDKEPFTRVFRSSLDPPLSSSGACRRGGVSDSSSDSAGESRGSEGTGLSFRISKFRTPDVASKENVRFWGAHEAGPAPGAGLR